MEKEIDISRIFFELSRKKPEATNYETDYSVFAAKAFRSHNIEMPMTGMMTFRWKRTIAARGIVEVKRKTSNYVIYALQH